MAAHVLGVFVEQVELHIFAFVSKCLREENVFEFEPIPLAPTLLLLHLNISHPTQILNSYNLQFISLAIVLIIFIT